MSEQKTILLIDDEIDLQQLVKIALKSKGYVIETANNGVEGLAKLETVKPDLIILDMNMPKMGGIEFYQKISGKVNQPKYPVLILTARANMEKLFKEFNIDGFMAKPFEVDELLEAVDTIIKKKSGVAKTIRVSAGNQPPKVCVAENDEQAFNKIGSAFLSAGYMVNPARSGTEAIERISAIVPEVAVIKLGLVDISGEIVVGKLKRMAKTQGVKFILYTEYLGENVIDIERTEENTGDTKQKIERINITQRISEKEGVDRFVEYSNVQQLVGAVNELLRI